MLWPFQKLVYLYSNSTFSNQEVSQGISFIKDSRKNKLLYQNQNISEFQYKGNEIIQDEEHFSYSMEYIDLFLIVFQKLKESDKFFQIQNNKEAQQTNESAIKEKNGNKSEKKN